MSSFRPKRSEVEESAYPHALCPQFESPKKPLCTLSSLQTPASRGSYANRYPTSRSTPPHQPARQSPDRRVLPRRIQHPHYQSRPPNEDPFHRRHQRNIRPEASRRNAIHGTVRYRIARDAAGRTMAEMPTSCYTGDDEHRHQSYQVNVYDRSTNTNESGVPPVVIPTGP
jgi:hypothetical protein